MRILHTADWHFGKTLEGRDRAPEQWKFIEELAAICDAESVDLVLMAGDVYQTVNPSAEAEEMFYHALHRLAAGGRRGVVIIAGNHDHADRIRAPRWLADPLGIVLVGLPKDEIRPTEARRDGAWRPWGGVGAVELAVPSCPHRARIAAVPYPSESRLGEVLSESLEEREMRRSYSDRLAGWFAVLARHFRPDTVNLLASHVYVAGGIETDSEIQIQVGGAYAVDASAFPATAQYVALGHLHRPQEMEGPGGVPIRYAGSPIAYSFSEAGQQKSVTLVDVEPGQRARWWEIPLSCGRPLVRWRASSLAEVHAWLDEGRDADAWIDLEVRVDTEMALRDIQDLRGAAPHIVHIRPVLPMQEAAESLDAQVSRPISPEALFRRFFEEKVGLPPDDALVRLFLGLVQDVETDEAEGTAESAEAGEEVGA
ncbi:exonuclease SbcCD subunit D [Alicyclobacillus acidocaldarius]|uniref:Nuclease SbcCD subunit D n=1 Tax=Alicyclobacillus acidocaldarius subsp. acidocaldarius (strain ATCC 27009 / DSM 446 / BCRC 14685 / JCM 5260 / KCTC 1825 / NBRC 15652 / NCIMB 11725 / NRRL B-14509 / 104-IA) TaxID=521098 RepID=C8WRD7_ALIAD|nr:exonuclease SbcCD subunit D [Alicyclobacillus acidocaldarius]ACV57342.1 nuclease SbcCD, D subunit [Alicyclobacillus acidocaldarius subsp. acidocaldarius DSM 446]